MPDGDYYAVADDQFAVPVSYTAWGWMHLALGLLLVLAGVGVLLGRRWARAVAVGLAIVSALVNLLFMKAYLVGATIVVVLDLLEIFALIVHGGEAAANSDRRPDGRAPGGPLHPHSMRALK